MESYETLGVIGEGTYGVVIKARHRASGQLVAIKKFKQADDDDHVRKTSLREVRVLKQLHHPNVVALLDVFRRDGKLYLVFEYIENTILQLLEGTEAGLSPGDVRRYMYQLLRGVDYCHAHSVIHRDVKPENILVSEDKVLKVCDFGFARHLTSKGKYTDYVATRWYRAPELLVGDVNYGKAVDIWAVGCIFAEISDTQPLFPGDSDLDQLSLILRTCGPIPQRMVQMFERNPLYRRVSFPHTRVKQTLQQRFRFESPDWLEFLLACLQTDPDMRPSCSELMSLPYFTRDNFRSEYEMELRRLNAPSLAPRTSDASAAQSHAKTNHSTHAAPHPAPNGTPASELPSLSLCSQPFAGPMTSIGSHPYNSQSTAATTPTTSYPMKSGASPGTDLLPESSQFPAPGRLSLSKASASPPAVSLHTLASPLLGLPELPLPSTTPTLPDIALRRGSQPLPHQHAQPTAQDAPMNGARISGEALIPSAATAGLTGSAMGQSSGSAATSSSAAGGFPQLSVLWAQYLGGSATAATSAGHPPLAPTTTNNAYSTQNSNNASQQALAYTMGSTNSTGRRTSGLAATPLPLPNTPSGVEGLLLSLGGGGGGTVQTSFTGSGRYGVDLEGNSLATSSSHLPPLVGAGSGLAAGSNSALQTPGSSSVGMVSPIAAQAKRAGIPSPLSVNATTVQLKPRQGSMASSLTSPTQRLAAVPTPTVTGSVAMSSTAGESEFLPVESSCASPDAPVKKGKKKTKGNAREPAIAVGASPMAKRFSLHSGSLPSDADASAQPDGDEAEIRSSETEAAAVQVLPTASDHDGNATSPPATTLPGTSALRQSAESQPPAHPLPAALRTETTMSSSAPPSVSNATRIRLDSANVTQPAKEASPHASPVARALMSSSVPVSSPTHASAGAISKVVVAVEATASEHDEDPALSGEDEVLAESSSPPQRSSGDVESGDSSAPAELGSDPEKIVGVILASSTSAVSVSEVKVVVPSAATLSSSSSSSSSQASSSPPSLPSSSAQNSATRIAQSKHEENRVPAERQDTASAESADAKRPHSPAVVHRVCTPPIPKPRLSRPGSSISHSSVAVAAPPHGSTAVDEAATRSPHSPPAAVTDTPTYKANSSTADAAASSTTRTVEDIIAANATAVGLTEPVPPVTLSPAASDEAAAGHGVMRHAQTSHRTNSTAASGASSHHTTPRPQPTDSTTSSPPKRRGSSRRKRRTYDVEAADRTGSVAGGSRLSTARSTRPAEDISTLSNASPRPAANPRSASRTERRASQKVGARNRATVVKRKRKAGTQQRSLSQSGLSGAPVGNNSPPPSLPAAGHKSRVQNDTGLNLTPLRDDDRSLFRQRFAQYYRANNRPSNPLEKLPKTSLATRQSTNRTVGKTGSSITQTTASTAAREATGTTPPLGRRGQNSITGLGGASDATSQPGRAKASRATGGIGLGPRGSGVPAPTLHDLVMAPYEKSNSGKGIDGGLKGAYTTVDVQGEGLERGEPLGLSTRPAHLYSNAPIATPPPAADGLSGGPQLGRLRRGPGGNHVANHTLSTSVSSSSQQRAKPYGAQGTTRAQPVSGRTGTTK